MNKDEAMKLALEALENAEYGDYDKKELNKAIIALREELAREAPTAWVTAGPHTVPLVTQPAHQEPVAVVSGYYGGQCVILPTDPARIFNSNTALYTSPPAQQEPVGEVVLFGGDHKEVSWAKGKLPSVGTKLYDRPQAQQEPVAAPEPRGLIDIGRIFRGEDK